MSPHYILWNGMVLYFIWSYCTVLHCYVPLLQRAGELPRSASSHFLYKKEYEIIGGLQFTRGHRDCWFHVLTSWQRLSQKPRSTPKGAKVRTFRSCLSSNLITPGKSFAIVRAFRTCKIIIKPHYSRQKFGQHWRWESWGSPQNCRNSFHLCSPG